MVIAIESGHTYEWVNLIWVWTRGQLVTILCTNKYSALTKQSCLLARMRSGTPLRSGCRITFPGQRQTDREIEREGGEAVNTLTQLLGTHHVPYREKYDITRCIGLDICPLLRCLSS